MASLQRQKQRVREFTKRGRGVISGELFVSLSRLGGGGKATLVSSTLSARRPGAGNLWRWVLTISVSRSQRETGEAPGEISTPRINQALLRK